MPIKGRSSKIFKVAGMLLVFEFIGRNSLRFLRFVGETALLFAETVSLLVRRINFRNTINQMASLGVNSIPIVLITVAFSGAVLSLQSAYTAVKTGLGQYVGYAVAISIVREAGPILTALVVAARVGSAIAAELGTMKITEQIDALKTLATNPVEYLVVPRFLACLIMLPVLTLYADVVGVGGGYLVAVPAGVNPVLFLESIRTFLDAYDVVGGVIKSLFFGIIIAIVSSHQGLKASAGAAGVGRATTNSVVLTIILVYAANYFLSWLIFGVLKP